MKKLFGNDLSSRQRTTHKGFGAVPKLNNALPSVSSDLQRKDALAELRHNYPGMEWSDQARNKRLRQRRELPDKIQKTKFKLESYEAQLQELKAYEDQDNYVLSIRNSKRLADDVEGCTKLRGKKRKISPVVEDVEDIDMDVEVMTADEEELERRLLALQK